MTPEETNARTVIQSFGDYRNLAPRPFHQEDQPTVMPGEDNNIAKPASRVPIQEPTSPSINGDLDVISSGAKIRRKSDTSKSHDPRAHNIL